MFTGSMNADLLLGDVQSLKEKRADKKAKGATGGHSEDIVSNAKKR